MTGIVRKFMTWWESLPVLIGFFFIPLVMALYFVARIKNSFTKGE